MRFSRKRQDGSVPHFFQDLGENTCSYNFGRKHSIFFSKAVSKLLMRPIAGQQICIIKKNYKTSYYQFI